MKKLLIVLLSLALIFAFAACGQNSEAPAADAELQPINIGLLALNAFTEEEQDLWTTAISPAPEGCYWHHIFYDDMTSLLLALDNRDVDIITTNQLTAKYLMAAVPDAYTMQEETYHSLAYSIAASEDNAKLLETLNTALDALDADGTLAALEAEYLENIDPANMPAPAKLPQFEGEDTVRVVVTGDVPPMDFMTADGQAAGYNVALLSAIARQAQINFELVSANAASRALMITSDKADLVFWYAATYENGQLTSNDLPIGMAMTRPYLTVPDAALMSAEVNE